MGKNLVEDVICIPRRAAANEFAIGCSKGVEDGIVEFLVVWHKIKFIRIHNIKRWASDCFRVVWESLNAASVVKIDFCFLGFKTMPGGSLCAKAAMRDMIFWFDAKKVPLYRLLSLHV